MALPDLWNPDAQFELDPETGQYAKQSSPQLEFGGQQAGTDWTSVEQQLRAKAGNLYDPSDLEGIIRNTTYNEPGKAVSLDQALANQFGIYNQRSASGSSPQQSTSQYSSGSAAGAGDAALSQFMQYLQSQQSQQAQQQASLREILMGQLGQATQPVSLNSPGIREVLAGGRIGLQRGAEQQRKDAAELRAYDGSGGLGGKAFEGDVNRIDQQRGESEAQMNGQVLGQELNAKRDQLNKLLTLAMSLGDSESARNIQAQLGAIQTQLQQSNFYDTTAFNYAGLNSNNNMQALAMLLNAA